MHLKRVQEILRSPEQIEVLYKDTPVWIESFDHQEQTARVKFLDETSRVADIDIKGLVENGLT